MLLLFIFNPSTWSNTAPYQAIRTFWFLSFSLLNLTPFTSFFVFPFIEKCYLLLYNVPHFKFIWMSSYDDIQVFWAGILSRWRADFTLIQKRAVPRHLAWNRLTLTTSLDHNHQISFWRVLSTVSNPQSNSLMIMCTIVH